MKERLNQLHAKLFMNNLHISTSLDLHPLPEDIMQDLNETRISAYTISQNIHRRKFHKLLEAQHQLPQRPPMQYKLDSVLNLSSRTLTPDETRILSLGFNFRPSLPHFPTQDYIFATESYIKSKNLSSEEGAHLRNTVIHELHKIQSKIKYRPPRSNLSPRDWKIINALKSDDSIIIIPADKGNKTIILDKQVYLDKLQERIHHHKKIQFDPTIQRENKLNDSLKSIHESLPTTPPKTIPTRYRPNSRQIHTSETLQITLLFLRLASRTSQSSQTRRGFSTS
jgi:hypothetical protein